jgi:hypothetical protein
MQNPMQERLYAHLFAPQTWLKGSLRIARYHQNKIAPVGQFSYADYDCQAGRLALLTDGEWQLLGLAAACAPFSGSIGNSLHAKFARAVRAKFSEQQITQLDALPVTTTFLLSPKAWENPEQIMSGAIGSVIDSLESGPVTNLVLRTRFDTPLRAVEGLTPFLIEELCKISLPTLPWLQPSPPSASLPE